MRRESDIVTQAINFIKNPVDRKRLHEKREEQNTTLADYVEGKISFDKCIEQMTLLKEQYNDILHITFANPWSIYGLLRKLSLQEVVQWETEEIVQIVSEERDHFLEAARKKLSPEIHVVISTDADNQTKRYFLFTTAYTIPDNPLDIVDISLATPYPSSDDLAKLPGGGLVFEEE